MDGRQALAALNEEWQGLARLSVPGWASAEPELRPAESLSDVLGLISRRPDPVLAALLRLGARGDRLAHRVVLQTMLGKLVLLFAGRPELLAEATSELWLAIAEYPVDRRPRAIASNLAWAVRRRLPRPSTGTARADQWAMPEPPQATATPDASGTLHEARELGLIDERTHRTLWAVYVAGLSSAQAAVELDSTPESVRWRCSWALRRLAAHAELLAA